MNHLLKMLVLFGFFNSSCQGQPAYKIENKMDKNEFSVQKSEKEWKKELTNEQYIVLREKGTERPHTGKYNLFFEKGVYHCAGCGQKLFSSDSKFKSSCGWPSFDSEIEAGKIKYVVDQSFGMVRTEIVCANCGGHLGHVFEDGPTETGLRYCVNSISVDFREDEE